MLSTESTDRNGTRLEPFPRGSSRGWRGCEDGEAGEDGEDGEDGPHLVRLFFHLLLFVVFYNQTLFSLRFFVKILRRMIGQCQWMRRLLCKHKVCPLCGGKDMTRLLSILWI